MVRKGFINTLESVIASSLILGIVLALIGTPAVSESGLDPTDSIYNGLENLDSQDELENSPEDLELLLDGHVPSGFDFIVEVTEIERTYEEDLEINGENTYTASIDDGEEYSELKLWIDSNNGLDINIDDTFVETVEDTNYTEIPLDSAEGELEIEGEAELDLAVENHVTDSSGEVGESSQTNTVTYTTPYQETLANIRVVAWR